MRDERLEYFSNIILIFWIEVMEKIIWLFYLECLIKVVTVPEITRSALFCGIYKETIKMDSNLLNENKLIAQLYGGQDCSLGLRSLPVVKSRMILFCCFICR